MDYTLKEETIRNYRFINVINFFFVMNPMEKANGINKNLLYQLNMGSSR